MKHNPLSRMLYIAAAIAATALAVNLNAQTNLTGDEVLAEIMSGTNETPLNIYPPDYFDWLASIGTNQMPSTEAGPQRPVRDVPVGPLIADDLSFGGGFGMLMAMDRPAPTDPAPQNSYTVVDLGAFYVGSFAYAINKGSQVAGMSYTGPNTYSGFLYSGNSLLDIGNLGDNHTVANAINDKGQITGWSQISSGGRQDTFIYSSGSMLDICPGLGYGINNNGEVVGVYNSNTRAFKYSGGSQQDLGTLGGSYSWAYGIDDYGDVAGNAGTTGNVYTHAFLYTNGIMGDIGTLGGNNSTAYGINSYAEVVGGADDVNQHQHAFFYDYQNGTMEDLGVLPGATTSVATGVNNAAHVVGASGDHAFLVSNGSMQDLNSLVINNGSGWTISYAYGINDKDEIVGVGVNPAGQSHAFLLKPLPGGWQPTISADTSRTEFPIIGNRAPGADKLIFITHGRIPDDPNVDTAWVDSMSNAIAGYLNAHGLSDWQVIGYKWTNGAEASIFDVIGNAKQQGANVGQQILDAGFTHVHFISHSAGAAVIQTATDVIKNPTTGNPNVVIHETFLDPYVNWNFSEAGSYGNGANWAENYFTRDQETEVAGSDFPYTEFIMPNTYNVDVTQLDVNDRVKRNYFVTGSGTTCYKTKSGHIWPVNFYSNTITGTVTSDYEGYGFPLSEIGGNWTYATNNYHPGNGRLGNQTPLKQLGTSDPDCFLDVPAPTYPSIPTDFLNSPTVQNDPMKVVKYPNSSVKQLTGSPAWLATFVTVTNVINEVAFDAEFQSGAGAQGLLSVYWDSNTIGTIDERMVQTGFQHYAFRFPLASTNDVHMLGFRLDPFTNIQSVIVITNVVTTASGVTEPFSLSVVGNTNGLQVYQLNGQAGFEYGVQASTDLVNWTNIASLINTNGTVQFFDSSSTNYSQRFYRAVAPF